MGSPPGEGEVRRCALSPTIKTSRPVEDVKESEGESLARALHQELALNALPPETIRELLEGRGDVEEAIRAIAMDFLGGF